MSTLLSIAERSVVVVAGAASAGVRAAGQIVTAVRGGDPGGAAPAPKSRLTDAALAHKVESVLFRDGAVPKGDIDVNAVGRVVYLRGKARSATMVADLSVRTQAIAEVERVENLLETPRTRSKAKGAAAKRASKGTPAKRASRGTPAKRASGSKGAAAKRGSSARGRQPSRRVNAEVPPTAPEAEPTPRELAAKGEGRRAAPLGSSDSDTNTPAAPKPDEDVGN
ncbi:MAG: BON domain-containing protein [Actinomycetota bacterium]|nr:BON domain-containing protein [Actinomycetota bacterium]